ncbi:hypothetical protein BI032_gp093 [Citrobacter phage vB_CfrM_CfP1]|uniref:Uncharacterized protein n=1 Tax=Citrobacter phage vB_CfrM_CfP1 TaxID=1871313 RepID=A0A1B1IXE6_9CAUD|nr:hypothetical protein BI032_gp093 [Citrobacter phage vB_CfrM_CfP1]ANS05993.1 hypothetical protein ABCD_0256 [Citrobacter phage vB_CfrM_CfP1]
MELFAGKTYTLTVPPAVFAEKTWKTALAALIEEKGSIKIDRTSIGEFEDRAFVIDGEYEYEIPSSHWKYFKEVSEDETVEEVEPLPEVQSDTREMDGRIARGIIAQNIEKLDIPTFTFQDSDGVKTMPLAPYSPIKNLDIQTSFGKELEEIRIVPDPCNKSGLHLRFALQHLFNGGSIYQIDMESSLKTQEEEIEKLFNLHTRLDAVNHIEKLIGKEKARIVQELAPYGKNDESRNLRNSRKRS